MNNEFNCLIIAPLYVLKIFSRKIFFYDYNHVKNQSGKPQNEPQSQSLHPRKPRFSLFENDTEPMHCGSELTRIKT